MSINININYKNPNHIIKPQSHKIKPNHIKKISNHIKQEGKQITRGYLLRQSQGGVHNGKTCPHESHDDL
jgi:hypothetical protein